MAKINNKDDEASEDALVSSRWRNVFTFFRVLVERLRAVIRDMVLKLKKINEKWPVFGPISRAVLGLAGEITAIVLGLAFFWLCAINVILARQSVDLSPFQTDAENWFENAFEGHHADVGDIRLDWNAVKNTFTLEVNEIFVYDAENNIVEHIENISTELALIDILQGRLDPFHMKVIGGEVTLLRRENGDMIAGLGTPKTVGRLGPVWRGRRESQQPFKAGQWKDSSLKVVDVSQVVFHLVDEINGLEWQLLETDIFLDRSSGGLRFAGQSYLNDKKENKDSAGITGKDNRVFIKMNGEIAPDRGDIQSEILLTNFNPSKLFPDIEAYKPYTQIDAPLTLDAKIGAKRGIGLELFELDFKAEKGRAILRNEVTPLQSASVKAHYDLEQRALNFTEIDLKSDKVKLSGTAKLGDVIKPADIIFKGAAAFETRFDRLEVDWTPFFITPLDVENVIFQGAYDRPNRTVEFEKIAGDFGAFQPNLSGGITFGAKGGLSGLLLNGPIDGKISPQDLLGLWPLPVADGARQWVKRSALGGYLENVNFNVNITQDMLAALPPLPFEAVTASFDFKDGTIAYISTMTPATNIQGSGTLNGNSGEFLLNSGNVGRVNLTKGRIDIPVFYPKGGDLNIDVDGEGPLSQLVTLIDQKPFEYASQYGVDPKAFSGAANVNLKVTRPLRINFNPELIKYTISGSASDIHAPFGIGQYQIEDGEMTLYADREGLVAKGPANIGPWRPEIAWREIFDFGATPTRYSVSGVIGRDELDGFGIGLREYFGGEIGLNIDARANGLEITGADVTANFVNSEMRIGPYWSKLRGVKGRLTGQLSREQNGRVRLSDIVMNAPGLEIEGYLDMGGDFRLLNLDFKKAKITSFVDAALQIKPSENSEKFDLFLTGDYLDVSPFIAGMMMAQPNTFDVPILLTASLRRLALNDAFSLRDSTILFAHDGVGVRQARLKGDTLEGALVAEVTTDDQLGVRTVHIDVPSTSEAAYAFFGIKSLIGGRMQIDGTLPVTGELGPVSGEAVVDDITVVNAPAMTRLLSVASLKGLSNVMSGEGLKFESLIVPFSLENQVLSIRDARAAGSGLGMTSNGEISFADKALDLDGVLVPAYTANSMLGSVPVIGDIFVGKKGEGIFALSYTMRGPFEKSQVTVNPFSALTPGFLRGIFRPERKALPPSVLEQIENLNIAPDTKDQVE